MALFKPDILIADDDPAMVRLIRTWLEKVGHEVTCAQDGQEALSVIAQNAPHILITDWDMPKMDGLALCRRVRQMELPHYVYVIFLTTRDAQKDATRALSVGADDFVRKPVDRCELVARVRAGTRVLELEQRLCQIAQADPLTGLANQRSFYSRIAKEWNRANRYGFPLSVVMMDIDFFKRINDTYGHPVGDDVIRTVASSMDENSRDVDLVSRYGGEEFCVLLPETTESEAELWADRIRKIIAQATVQVGQQQIGVTCSFGAAERLDDTKSPHDLVDLADQALLVAKRSGRNRVVGYQSLRTKGGLCIGNEATTSFSQLLARDVMTPIVAPLNQHNSAGQAADYFLHFRISSAPVVDDSGSLHGVLSEKDVMSIMLSPNWWEKEIREIMKPNVVCYDEETPVVDIYEFLSRVSIRSVVIVRDEHPTGLVSRSCVLRWFTNNYARRQSSEQEGAVSGLRQRENLISTSHELLYQAQRLSSQLHDEPADVVPCLVGGASRIQELVNDLLAFSRAANQTNQASELTASVT